MDNVERNPTEEWDFIPELDFNEENVNPLDEETVDDNKTDTQGGEVGRIQNQPSTIFKDTTEKVEEEEEEETRIITPQDVDDTSEEETEGKKDGDNPEFEFSEEEDPTAVGIYKTMLQEGILEEREDFKGTFEDIREYINELPKRVAESIYKSSPEYSQALLEYIFTKGEDLSKEDLRSFVNDFLQDQDEMSKPDLDDLETAERFIRSHLSSKKIDSDIVDSTISGLLDKDPDGTEIIRKANSLWENTKDERASRAKERIEAERTAKETKERANKEFAKNVFEELDSMGWKPTKVKEVKQALVTNRVQDTLRQVFGNPKAYAQLANILTLYNPKDNVFNLKDFVVQAVSKDSKDVKRNIIEDNFKSVGTTTKGKVNTTGDKTQKSIWDNLEPVI